MKVSDYVAGVRRTYGDHGLEYVGLSLAGEAGELVELIKKQQYHGKEIPLSKFIEEAGDVMFSIAALCIELQIDMEGIMQSNLSKLAARYPNGFVLGGGNRD